MYGPASPGFFLSIYYHGTTILTYGVHSQFFRKSLEQQKIHHDEQARSIVADDPLVGLLCILRASLVHEDDDAHGQGQGIHDASLERKRQGQRHDGYPLRCSGYYSGIDPLDGGEQLVSITYYGDAGYSFLIRDSVVTVCGGGLGFSSGPCTIDEYGNLYCTAGVNCDENVSLVFYFQTTKSEALLTDVSLPDGTFITSVVHWPQ